MDNPLKTQYAAYIHKSRYARWRDDLGRREEWPETAHRLIDYWQTKFPALLPPATAHELYTAIYDIEIMPSMRCLMVAGKPLDLDNVAGFNCSYTPVDKPKRFDEILYILMCGTGVGFSVERQFVNQLPEIPDDLHPTDTKIVVADSKIGWATALRELISLLYAGKIPSWDVSKVRPSGARLKTFGGRASGPDPLVEAFKFTVETFKRAAGRKLKSLECHDLVCKIAECVVVGGVRRSALISLSNLSDDRMRSAKSGQWWVDNPQRSLANNSVCYTERPEIGIFMREWLSLYDSKSGERGIFNREAATQMIPDRRKEFGYVDFGTNPCSEIVLRGQQFCNLSEIIVRPNDTLESLKKKVRVATILGTLQATLTDFRYLSKEWKKNTEEEALLGVSLTGIMDHPVMNGSATFEQLETWLRELKQTAVETNLEWAKKLDINPAAAITCVKPSGTVSQLVDSASGIHPRYAPYYIRTVRADMKDPLSQVLIDSGIPHEPDAMRPHSTWVFSFPMKSPDSSVFRDDRSAIEQLELWKTYQLHWCEHKPSITVYVKENEWMEVGAWVWENFDIVSGVSFLPHSNHNYRQAPYQEITQEEYETMASGFPEIDWSLLTKYETDDQTTSTKELACTAGGCEI